jgi:hypothetical protein
MIMMKIYTDKILKADKRSKLEKLNKKSFFEILINKYTPEKTTYNNSYKQ